LDAEVDPVVTAVKKALVQRPAGPAEPYRPLYAAKRAYELVTGTRPPATAKETAFVASLPEDRLVRLVLASNRDDEDVTPVGAFLPARRAARGVGRFRGIGRFAGGSPACEVSGPGNTRLQGWGDKVRLNTGTDVALIAWPCSEQHTWDSLLSA